jgi:hypothetical protein
MADAKTLAAISQTYPTFQNGDLLGLERAGVAGKMTFSQFQANDFAWTGDHDFSGATVIWDSGPLDAVAASSITGVSGADLTLITGTAGSADQIGTWNADGDLVGINRETTITDVDTAVPSSGAVVDYTGKRPQTASGAGQWVLLDGADGAALSLPAGGTWAYFFNRLTTSSGAIAGTAASVAAGGTSIASAIAGTNIKGFAWRLA